MRVKSLDIRMADKYEENAGQFVGCLCLEGEQGRQEIRLTSSAISRIFHVIREDVVKVSKAQAKATDKAVEEAEAGPLLLANAHLDTEF